MLCRPQKNNSVEQGSPSPQGRRGTRDSNKDAVERGIQTKPLWNVGFKQSRYGTWDSNKDAVERGIQTKTLWNVGFKQSRYGTPIQHRGTEAQRHRGKN
jgi:hypothetical protein